MNITKDVYEHLMNFADDKDIVNMLSVNRKFSDPIFFQNVLRKRYPLLIPFKQKRESWRQFYLRMITYIAKLQEEFDIPYIPNPDFNPENFYKYGADMSKYYPDFDTTMKVDAIIYAVKAEDKKNVELLLNLIPEDIIDDVFFKAISYAYAYKPAMVKFLERLRLERKH